MGRLLRIGLPVLVYGLLSLTVLVVKGSSAGLVEFSAFLHENCVQCHGGDSTKAGVDFTTFTDEVDVWRERSLWSTARGLILEGEMPPEEEGPLSSDQKAFAGNWIQQTLDDVDWARIPRDPGFTPPRRLTGKEYNYTVADLFGLSLPQVYEFPQDLVAGDSFDNEVSGLSVEALWFEKALEAADATVRAVWSDESVLDRLFPLRPSAPPVEDEAIYVTSGEVSALCDTSGDLFTVVARVRGQPGRIFSRAPNGEDWGRGVKEFNFEGDALTYRVGNRAAVRAEGLDVDDDQVHWVGITVRDGYASLYLDGRFLAGRADMDRPDLEDHRLKIGWWEEEDPEDWDGDDEEEEDPLPALYEVSFFTGGLSEGLMRSVGPETSSDLLPRPTFQWREGMRTPLPEDFVSLEEAITTVLERFLQAAFRREPTDSERTRYRDLWEEGLNAGLTFDVAFQHTVATALVSPAFLFRSETTRETDGIYRVTGSDLANRLSYFLWSSMPDASLRAAGRDGSLASPEALLRHTDRLLNDPKGRRFFERFIWQWLRTEGLGDTIRPDPDRFPDVTPRRMASMREEGAVYFRYLTLENRSLLELLDSDYTFVDQELAAHYGFPLEESEGWRRVALSNAERGGLLTQAAALTVSSSPKRTSPVFRGKWLLEVILGEPPPPPPANVPELPEEEKSGGNSVRELLEAHGSQPACAGCHSRIDPFGLALEQYDPVGRLRPRARDTRTTLFTGESIDGVGDLKTYLLNDRSSDFLRHLVRRMLSYALGRELQFADERSVNTILQRLREQGGGARTLIHEVVLSEPFLYRKNPTYADE